MLARPSRLRLSQTPLRNPRAEIRRNLALTYTLHPPKREKYRDPSGTPIVMLHGLFGSKKNNRTVGKALVRDLGVSVYAVDLRNHGGSPHDKRHDYNAMADDIEEFLDEHNLPSVTLIGHSMGAKVAMVNALRSPDRIANLVSVDNAPVDAQLKNNFHKYIQGMLKVSEATIKRKSEADAILQEYEESPAIRHFLLTNLIRDPLGKEFIFRIPLRILGKALDNMGDFPYKDPQAARYEGRTLFIRGTKSHYIADDVLPLIGQFFPAFQLADIESGHWVISEQPDAFRKAVVDFLQAKK